MQQKMIINVDSPLKLSEMKDGDILIYDMTKRNFYVTTKKSLFQQEQREREEYQKEVNSKIEFMQQSYQNNVNFLTQEVEAYKAKFDELESKYNNFLAQYKDSNAKIIEMVEELVNGKE